MARPKVTNQLTITPVAKYLGMKPQRVIYWIDHGAFPLPSVLDDNGVRYFDEEWLKRARGVLEYKGLIGKLLPPETEMPEGT